MTCVADLQDPPELIPEFVQKWEEGYKVVIGVKQGSKDSWLMSRTRKFYYWLVGRLSSDVELVHNFTGFGLYDREVIEQFRSTDEQVPLFPGSRQRLRVRASRNPVRAASPHQRPHEERLLQPLRRGHAGRHQPLEGAASPRHHGGVRHLRAQPAGRVRVPGRQALVLGSAAARPGAPPDRHLLLRRRSALLHRGARRVHRLDPHRRSTSDRSSWRRSGSTSIESRSRRTARVSNRVGRRGVRDRPAPTCMAQRLRVGIQVRSAASIPPARAVERDPPRPRDSIEPSGRTREVTRGSGTSFSSLAMVQMTGHHRSGHRLAPPASASWLAAWAVRDP